VWQDDWSFRWELVTWKTSASSVYERLAIEDVSLEVSPHLAHDIAGTVDEARRLWKTVDRVNLMSKVPIRSAKSRSLEGSMNTDRRRATATKSRDEAALAKGPADSDGGDVIRIKRTYEPRARGDGRRILVERLWPRGMTKDAVSADEWMKEVAPTTDLRKWFGHRTERWEEFRQRYRKELDANSERWTPILDAARQGRVTLLYSARDTVHNGARVLRDFLIERRAKLPDLS
jgi:uncharacterized protein YeaO (DUF488 family)